MRTADGQLVDARALDHEQNFALLAPLLIEAGISHCWSDAAGALADAIAAQNQLVDVVITSIAGRDDEAGLFEIAGKIVKEAHRPVLAIPHHVDHFTPDGKAIVAWDGSRPAASALRAAAPLLQQAKEAHIVCVGGEHMQESLASAAAYCSLYNAQTSSHLLPKEAGSPAAMLSDFVEEKSASWIVMGAYGHSKLREDLFGGVTRSMLAASPVPLFLNH